ncbi:hypothetical protein KO317_00050 [Candidatus Micrarchaeota archaeon]|jgi:mRNA-degrading endonuclease RelE of RelBE toxin-antitoxin system|nr:hypothetical protein [Candidatus Micrarchaeota archaeon]
MKVIFLPQARKEFLSLDKRLQSFFIKHIEKLEKMPPRRHMKYGIPQCVENVTRQARLVYEEEKDILYIHHCFATHKEYEKWYRSFI